MLAVRRAAPADDASDDDAALVVAAQRDRAAFAPLYARYARLVYRYCYRRLGDHEAAEDATSQTFIKALDGLGRFGGGSFRAWLFAIADRDVTDRYRRRRLQVGIDEATMLASAECGPEETAIAAETRWALYAALPRLTADQQRVVALRLSGLSGPEIAAVIGRDLEAVKGLQYRAYARLRCVLGDEGADRRE